MTPTRRRVLSFIKAKAAKGEAYTLGQIMRTCGFSCRANARRTVKDLREMEMIN